MANNNMYIRCLICHPHKGEPVDWASEMNDLHYVASGYPGEPWVTKRESNWADLLNSWMEKHYHLNDPRTGDMHFELVDEVQ